MFITIIDDQCSCEAYKEITCGIFDRRWDGGTERAQLALCLPRSGVLTIFPLFKIKNKEGASRQPIKLRAISVAAMKILRTGIQDILIVKPDGTLAIIAYSLRELPLLAETKGKITGLEAAVESSVTMRAEGQSPIRVTVNLVPAASYVQQMLSLLATVLPELEFYTLHHAFLLKWSARQFSQDENTFEDLCSAILGFLGLDPADGTLQTDGAWATLGSSSTATRFANDVVLRKLKVPTPKLQTDPPPHQKPVHKYHSSVLLGLHHLAQCFLLSTNRHKALMQLVPTICRLAYVVRPEWADYWKRLFPDASGPWRSPQGTGTCSAGNVIIYANSTDVTQCLRTSTNDYQSGQPMCSPAYWVKSTTLIGTSPISIAGS
jgi:anaphase-promoting complex subunit 1